MCAGKSGQVEYKGGNAVIREIVHTLTKKGKCALALSIAGFTVYALSGAVMMLSVLKAMEDVGAGKGGLLRYGLLFGSCLLIKCGCSVFADMQKHFAGFDLVYEIRSKIIRRLKTFSLGFYTNERLGEIGTIIHKDVDTMELVVGHLWTRMCADGIVSAVLLPLLFFADMRMALITIAGISFALLFLVRALKTAGKMEAGAGDRLADMVSLFVEYVKGIPLLKAFSESKRFDEKLVSAAGAFGDAAKRIAKYKAALLSVYGFFLDATFWLTATAGIFFIVDGTLPLMRYLLFIILSREFYKPFVAMETHWMNYLAVTDSFRRIKKITDAPAVSESAHPKMPKEFSIAFDGVGFLYEEGGFAMKDISFYVPARTLTALVGASGSGKTTVTNLLLRFWDVRQGAVRIGDVDVRDMAYDELLGSVSIVMQDVKLFADTIGENIRLGKAGAADDEVIRAAKRARIHDFIVSLPDGYRTIVGENGTGLSGGQKQRISIARAFLKDAPILLLDEITSSVDPVNEALLQEAISELAKDRTVLVVAHHLNTIRSADQILVFENGAIVQAGTHEALLSETDGAYCRLWRQGCEPCERPGKNNY